MPSPFPGMDPFIEGQMWEDFHHGFIEDIRDQLTPLLLPKYIPRVELRVYIEFPPDVGTRQVQPDVGVVVANPWEAPRAHSTTAIAEPTMVEVALLSEREEGFITIRDAECNEVVTVIELLSPSNKRRGGDGYREYLHKRDAILASYKNLVELDLLRGGSRMPTRTPMPQGDYFALVRRGEDRQQAEVYPWRLADPLPIIPIPLLSDDPDARLDLGLAFKRLYDRARYDFSLHYQRPVTPPLSAEESKWAEEILAGRKLPMK